MQAPTVVNVKTEDFTRYIGRDTPRSKDVRLKVGHCLANPYHIGLHGTRAAALDQYETLMRARLTGENAAFWQQELRLLAGHRLGCWCKPAACHGDVLVKLWLEYYGE